MVLRLRSLVLTALATLAAPLTLAGCGGSTPPEPVVAPPEFKFDEATMKAATDAKFAEFAKLCEARGVEAKKLEAFNKAHPKPRSESDQAAFEAIQGAIIEATTKIKQAMGAAEWTPEDRKVLQYLFATKAGG